jgi:hypothetical protein
VAARIEEDLFVGVPQHGPWEFAAGRRFPSLKRLWTDADIPRMRRIQLGWFELAAALLLVVTAVDGVYTGHGWHNSDFVLYTATGKIMLSGAWMHTFHNPEVQAAPFELMLARALHWIAGSSHILLAVLTETILCAALIATFRSFVGRRTLPLIVFVAAAIALGPVPDAYATGHYAEPVAGMLWLLAARRARAGRVVTAGLLIGASAGFELWGVLGITVLALAPSFRRAVGGAVIAGAVPGLMLLPFVLGGDFHMFQFHWYVAGGPIHLIVGSGYPFGWPLRLLQAGATVGIVGGLARLIRRNPAAIFVIPAATTFVRLIFDPLGMFYYWDPVLEVALMGAAAAFVRREQLVGWAESAAARLAPA